MQVTAALITMQGRLFIAQRPPHKKCGLQWEFPGGKVEEGETLEASLVREISEELCWDIQVRQFFKCIRHNQPDLFIDLHAFWCTIKKGDLCLREHIAYHWASQGDLARFWFARADQELVADIEKLTELPHWDTDSAQSNNVLFCKRHLAIDDLKS